MGGVPCPQQWVTWRQLVWPVLAFILSASSALQMRLAGPLAGLRSLLPPGRLLLAQLLQYMDKGAALVQADLVIILFHLDGMRAGSDPSAGQLC